MSENILSYYGVRDNDYVFEGKKYCMNELENWEECENDDPDIEIEESEDEPDIVIDNPYGYSGTFNETNFCIKKHIDEKDIKDTRFKTTGRTCPASMKMEELVDIIIKLQVPFKNSNKRFSGIDTMSREALLDSLKQTKLKNLSKFDDIDIEDLKRALYFSTSKEICCSTIRKWFEDNSLLVYDKMCGVKGAKKL